MKNNIIYMVTFSSYSEHENMAAFSDLRRACIWAIGYYKDHYPYTWRVIESNLRVQGVTNPIDYLMTYLSLCDIHIETYGVDYRANEY